jgi:hypothetical protein
LNCRGRILSKEKLQLANQSVQLFLPLLQKSLCSSETRQRQSEVKRGLNASLVPTSDSICSPPVAGYGGLSQLNLLLRFEYGEPGFTGLGHQR